MSGRRTAGLGLVGCATVLAVLLAGAGPGRAAPPPPANPSDSDLTASRDAVQAKGAEVGALANKLSALENQLAALQDALEAKQENANKALVDMQSAQDDAEHAEQAAHAARVEADAAGAVIAETRGKLDQFVGTVYQQGVDTGAASVLLGAQTPADVLDRAALVDAVSRDQLEMLDALERARVDKANKDSAARATRDAAITERARSERAKHAADVAVASARQASVTQVDAVHRVDAERADTERQLTEAQQRDTGLNAQRQRYVDWQAELAREQAAELARLKAEATARLKAEAAARVESEAAARSSGSSASVPRSGGSVPRSSGGSGGSIPNSDGGSGGSVRSGGPAAAGRTGHNVQVVIDRAMSQLGVPYAWGGGNSTGPTLGIRDGGVADSFGDFNKVGFDCSGLMIYAFAGAGISLPHYSGYQYTSGPQVPLDAIRAGDMLFYGGSEGIHHVALYIGDGRMVEAPFSGSQVRVVTVRYSGGIMPFATRML